MDKQLDRYKPASGQFEYRNFPFYWISRVWSAYSLRMERHLKRAKLNTTTWRIIMILNERGCLSVSELATHAVAKTPTITKAIYKMQDDSIVEIFPSKTDGRVSMVLLTAKGRKILEEIIQDTQKVFHDAYADLSHDEIDNLNLILRKLFANLD
jgi:DNA-binding MarR family transcriptional regulator